MGDTNDASMADNSHHSNNPRDVLADLFAQSHPNIAWAIYRAPAYSKTFEADTAYAALTDHNSDFLGNIEAGLELLSNGNTTHEQTIATLQQTIAALQQSNQALNALVASLQATASQSTTTTANTQPKRKAKDPPAFDGKGSPIERQEKFEIWETKIRNVFQRDDDCFRTQLDEVLYMSEMLTDKAYDYVKHGLDMLRQDDPKRWVFSDRESMFEHMGKHYKTIDTTQVAKNKLDTLTQGERNYWSWKAELDELMIKVHKTEEQKVDLLKKNISPGMKALVLSLPSRISTADYEGWSEQMDIFAHNLQDHNHQAKLNNPKPSGYRPYQPSNNTAAPAPVGEPMDLDRISDNERKRRIDNKLCLACGLPGHWKEAHDPAMTTNPIPMPARQTTPQLNRSGPPRGRGLHYGRGGRGGRGGQNPTGSPAHVIPYMGPPPFNNPQQQWQMRLADSYEPGYIVGEESASTTPTNNDSMSQSEFIPPRQDNPAPQSLKGQPLN